MERIVVGRTRNGEVVYFDNESTHAHTHFSDAPELLEFVSEALGMMDVFGENVYLDVDLGREVGESSLVATGEDDEIFYAKRLNRDAYTRFVRNREKPKTSFVSVVLHRIEDGYRLYSAWFGKKVPPFPGDDLEWEERSREFWKNHALVFDGQEIQARSETSNCPWI